MLGFRIGTQVATVAAVMVMVAWIGPKLAKASSYCHGQPGCDYDKVAMISCKTQTWDRRNDSTIRVESASVTGATGVTVRQGDDCAATVSALLQAGLRMLEPGVTAGFNGHYLRFHYVFVGHDPQHEDSEYDEDDDRDSNDD